MSKEGETVVFFVMKAAITRLGGTLAAAEKLGVSVSTVRSWTSIAFRNRPRAGRLRKLAELSGISLESFLDYYKKVEQYKKLRKD
ncbi:MAG: hypothetical protein E6Q97_28580 [Desulfurellales bacterium]|nr:MAG: hypothetical protein E6Q97_28580 [Desulfurellales bacterium]